MPKSHSHLLQLLAISLLLCGCGLQYAPHAPPTRTTVKYNGFELSSEDRGQRYDWLTVDAAGCATRDFSVSIPELGKLNFADFADRRKDLEGISKGRVKDGRGHLIYANLFISYVDGEVEHVSVDTHTGASPKPIVLCFYKEKPMLLPLNEDGLTRTFGKRK